MSMQLSKSVTCPMMGDGIATSFSMTVSDVCLYSDLPDFSPIDAVSSASISGLNSPDPVQILLNNKGTIITGSFATPPPAGFGFQLLFTMFRNI